MNGIRPWELDIDAERAVVCSATDWWAIEHDCGRGSIQICGIGAQDTNLVGGKRERLIGT